MKSLDLILYHLTEDEKQLLKDTIRKGACGDCDNTFMIEGERMEVDCYGYCTNDAKLAGHFSGREISVMFRSIYKKLCLYDRNQIGEVISHCHDWWGDGSGDMLFIRSPYYKVFEDWAKQ